MELLESKIIDIYTYGISNILVLRDISINLNDKKTSPVKKYQKFIESLGITQLISEPTRVTNTSSSIIDHILTNREDLYLNGYTYDLRISDHSLIVTNRKKAKLPRTFTYLNCRS